MKTHPGGFCAVLIFMVSMASYAGSSDIIAQQTTAWAQQNLQDGHVIDNQTGSPQTTLVIPKKNSTIMTNFDWEESRKSQYAIYRSQGKRYFKGKAGYMLEGLEKELWDMPLQEAKNTLNEKGSVGIGAGYRLKDGTSFEFEFTVNKQDEQQLIFGYQF
ncbi:MAG: hypothetical protein GXP14_16505 [Gammaproteobacteria bacterium]|nr:hypothetical protein [Gammaproteobacteria bacterium]